MRAGRRPSTLLDGRKRGKAPAARGVARQNRVVWGASDQGEFMSCSRKTDEPLDDHYFSLSSNATNHLTQLEIVLLRYFHSEHGTRQGAPSGNKLPHSDRIEREQRDIFAIRYIHAM